MVLAGCHGKSPEPKQNRRTEPVKISIFYTDDLQGEIDLCGCPVHKMGGVARRAKFIQRFFELKEPVVQVDAGDGFFKYHPVNAPVTDQEKSRAMVLARSAGKLKVDAINVGLWDLSAGVDFLKELSGKSQEKAKLNLISSNLFDQDQARPIFPTEKIIERAGVKIGIFGLCRNSPDLPKTISVLDPKVTAELMVKKLKDKNKVELVIGLFNLGLEESKRMVQQVPGIDLVVVSGMPQYLWTPELLNATVLFQSGAGGKYLGQLEIKYHPDKKPDYLKKELEGINLELERISRELGVLEGKLNQDPGLKNQYENLKKQKGIYERKQKEIITLPFEYQYVLVPMEETLPLDYEINQWVRQALNSPENPAGPAH